MVALYQRVIYDIFTDNGILAHHERETSCTQVAETCKMYVFHCRLVFANSFNMGAYCMHTSTVYHVFVQECASAYVYM